MLAGGDRGSQEETSEQPQGCRRRGAAVVDGAPMPPASLLSSELEQRPLSMEGMAGSWKSLGTALESLRGGGSIGSLLSGAKVRPPTSPSPAGVDDVSTCPSEGKCCSALEEEETCSLAVAANL